MRAAYWTAIGTLLIPIGVLLAIEKPEWAELAFGLIVAGLASFIAGWVYTIRDEQRKQRDERRRQKEYKLREEREELRLRGEKATFLALTYIVEKLGVDLKEFIKEQEKLLDGE